MASLVSRSSSRFSCAVCLFRAVFSDPVDYPCGAPYCNKVFATRRERVKHRKERHPAFTFPQGGSKPAAAPPPPTSSSSDDSSDADDTDPPPSQKKNKRKKRWDSLAQKKKGASNWQKQSKYQKLTSFQEYVRRLTSTMIFNNKMLSVLPMEGLGDPDANVSSRSLMVSNYWKYRMRGLSCPEAEQAVVQETCFFQCGVQHMVRPPRLCWR